MNSQSDKKERFTGFPSILQIDIEHNEDAEYIRRHFWEYNEQMFEGLDRLYEYIDHLRLSNFKTYKKYSAFVDALIEVFNSLDDARKSDRQRVIEKMAKYHAKVEEILNYDKYSDFQCLEDTVECIGQYRKKLVFAITVFQDYEWEDVLEMLQLIDDIDDAFCNMIHSIKHHRKEYEDITKKASPIIRNRLLM